MGISDKTTLHQTTQNYGIRSGLKVQILQATVDKVSTVTGFKTYQITKTTKHFKIFKISKESKPLYEPSTPSPADQKVLEKEQASAKKVKGSKAESKDRKGRGHKVEKEEKKDLLVGLGPALKKLREILAQEQYSHLTQKEKYQLLDKILKEQKEEKDVSNDE